MTCKFLHMHAMTTIFFSTHVLMEVFRSKRWKEGKNVIWRGRINWYYNLKICPQGLCTSLLMDTEVLKIFFSKYLSKNKGKRKREGLVTPWVCMQLSERPAERAGESLRTTLEGTRRGRPPHSPLPPPLCSCTQPDIQSARIWSRCLQQRLPHHPPPPLLPEGPGSAPTPRPRAAHSGSARWNVWERPCPPQISAVAQAHGWGWS